MQKQKKQKLQDKGKLAYMISWRDRRIKALEELIAAEQQAGSIYAAYIAYLLEKCGEQVQRDIELRVPKCDIRSVCGKYAVEAEDAGEDFKIILKFKGEEHGTSGREVVDA